MQLLNFSSGINFGSAGNLKEFSPVGFSASPDDVSTWSEASTCELAFRLPPMRQDLRFTIEPRSDINATVAARRSCISQNPRVERVPPLAKIPDKISAGIFPDASSPVP